MGVPTSALLQVSALRKTQPPLDSVTIRYSNRSDHEANRRALAMVASNLTSTGSL
jgi:hypothetical protein